jgi:predicted methyltransferase/S-adenosylmethionine/arginine decarboxylase-like enzyme
VQNIIDQIKTKNPDLKEAEIEGILYLIRTDPGITSTELIRMTGLPKETLKTFKSSISAMLEDPTGENQEEVLLKQEYIKDLEMEELKPYKWSLLDYSHLDLENRLKEIRKKHALEPKREYDQFFADIKTSVSKALILQEKGLVENKNIALIGDDDLVSIVLGLMGDNNTRITVYDIDRELLAVIERIADDMGIKNIRTQLYDVRQGINSISEGVYDVVIMDPPYTKAGMSAFLDIGIKLLGQDRHFEGKYIYLYYGNSFKNPEKTLKIQEIINLRNLVIEDKVDKFARYHGAESIGSASSLYILKTTPFTAASEDHASSQGFYTFDDRKEEKFPFVDHYTAKIYNVPPAIIGSKKAMLKIVGEFCRLHRLKVVDTKISKFKGQGLTLTYVLSNSNLLVHTWPELQAVHIDLITCSPIYNKENLALNLSDLFKSRNIEVRRIE